MVRGAVSPHLVNRALKSINYQIGEGIHPQDLPSYRASSYFPKLSASSEITDLVNETEIYPYVETLTGKNSLLSTVRGQIALRFPISDEEPFTIRRHLDGQWGKHEGVKKEDFGANFSVLVYVMLNDMNDTNCGNFSVWPGSHHRYEKHFKKYGADALLKGYKLAGAGEPVQITGSAGDVALVHYQLAHGPASNLSANIRYAVFFRLKNSARDSYKPRALTDIWLDFPALQGKASEESSN